MLRKQRKPKSSIGKLDVIQNCNEIRNGKLITTITTYIVFLIVLTRHIVFQMVLWICNGTLFTTVFFFSNQESIPDRCFVQTKFFSKYLFH